MEEIQYSKKLSYAKAKKIAEDTLDAIKAQKYKTPSGRTISLDKLISPAVRRSQLYKPGYVPNVTEEKNTSPVIYITPESTLVAAQRLSDKHACILNFASATNPGGGFLRGALAQEETLARSSALYKCLIRFPEYYEENIRSQSKQTGLYMNYAIYSPDVPFIRDDNGSWLADPYVMSVVTSPSPNKFAMLESIENPTDEELLAVSASIATVLFTRMNQVLSIMAEKGHRTIVLGAWGCGAFGNDPYLVAKLWKQALKQNPFFDEIVFAIYEPVDGDKAPNIQSFKKVFK